MCTLTGCKTEKQSLNIYINCGPELGLWVKVGVKLKIKLGKKKNNNGGGLWKKKRKKRKKSGLVLEIV